MNVFFDMEFSELRQDADPISLGMVADSGEMFYAEWVRFRASRWVRDNVVPHLMLQRYSAQPGLSTPDWPHGFEPVLGGSSRIQGALRRWLDRLHERNERIVLWSDVGDYDGVLLREIFAGAINLPEFVHPHRRDLADMIAMRRPSVDCFDLNREQWLDGAGGLDEVRARYPFAMGDGDPKHNALWDALVIRQVHKVLAGM